jgi:hypothetical protein
MRNRAELTDEELEVSCGAKLTWANIFFGFMFGTVAWIPAAMIYMVVDFTFPTIFPRHAALPITMGTTIGGGILWGIIAAERYRDTSFRFNRMHLKVLRDRVVRTQILWEDVVSVKRGAPYVVETRQGLNVQLPGGLFLGEKFENRALLIQLSKYQKPERMPSAKRIAWIGSIGLAIGVPLMAIYKRPYDVFQSADGLSASLWLRLLPSVLGLTFTVLGMFYLMMLAAILGDRKKPHPFQITDEGIREGKKLTAWADIERLTRLGLNEMQIQLDLRKGSAMLIDCDKYTDGADLRDAILTHAPAPPEAETETRQSMMDGQTITASSLKTQGGALGCLACFALLGPVMVIFAASGKMAAKQPSDNLMFEILGWMLFAMIAGVIVLATYRLELIDGEIRQKRLLLPLRTVKYSEIDRIEIRANRGKNGPVDLFTIRSKGASITFSSRLERYGEIRDTILSRVPAGKVRYS